jgi:hypothetical protein
MIASHRGSIARHSSALQPRIPPSVEAYFSSETVRRKHSSISGAAAINRWLSRLSLPRKMLG